MAKIKERASGSLSNRRKQGDKVKARAYKRREGMQLHYLATCEQSSRPDVLYLASATFLPTFY